MARGRLQNYPAHEFQTEDDWSAFFTNGIAPTCVRVRSGQPIAWSLRIANVQDLHVAYGAHGSDIEIDQVGAGDGLHVHIPLSGQAALTIGETTVVASNEQAILVDFGRPHRLKIQRSLGYQAIALNIPKRLLHEQIAAVSGHNSCCQIDFQPTLSLASAPGRTLASVANALVTGLENGLLKGAPTAMRALSQSLLHVLVQAGPHQLRQELEKPPPQIAPRHVRRAIEFMRANIAKPLSSAEIAAAAGVSVRSLEVGFRAFKGTTPMAYLRSIRLAAAHGELEMSNNSSTIAEIAYRWGFTHLGRFSAIYRETYGELPSQTVALRKE